MTRDEIIRVAGGIGDAVEVTFEGGPTDGLKMHIPPGASPLRISDVDVRLEGLPPGEYRVDFATRKAMWHPDATGA